MTSQITAFTMPKWGLTMTEGTVVGWLKAQGQSFKAGEELLEIETTKITNVFEAPEAGTLRRIVEKTVGRMRFEFGSRPQDVIAAIGPSIGPCCYEVSADFVTKFTAQFADAEEYFDEPSSGDVLREIASTRGIGSASGWGEAQAEESGDVTVPRSVPARRAGPSPLERPAEDVPVGESVSSCPRAGCRKTARPVR